MAELRRRRTFQKIARHETLAEEFKAAFPSLQWGADICCSVSVGVVSVDALDSVSDAAISAVITAHDPSVKDKTTLALGRCAAAAGEWGALANLKGKTPAQIATYVQNNVTDLASAKAAITLLAQGLAALARRSDIED